MQKIIYVLTKSGMGGAQKYVADLAKNLDANKFEAKVICGGVDVRWLSNRTHPWFLFANDWLAVFELVKIFKKEKPDVVHLNNSKAGVIGAIAGMFCGKDRPQIVFTAHGWVFNPTNEISWLVRQFYVFLHKISAKFQDKIICVSGYDYNLALEYDICQPEKLVKIHNGIDAGMKFLNKKEAREKIIEKIRSRGLDPSDLLRGRWVGSIGRLVKEKNYETFVKAAKSVLNAYFFVIGDGPEFKKLKSEIKDLKLDNRFFLISSGGDDAKYLKAFDVFVMSSVKEGLPYTLLEAMVAELPIVITEAGGMPELIKNHENGLMVAQKNPEALARAIGGLVENHAVAKELSQKAKEIVSDRFSLNKMVSETEKVYSFLDNK